MRLALQGEDTALFRRLLSDLSRTEQYVEMVMAFLRLEDAPGDYVFREVSSGAKTPEEAVRRATGGCGWTIPLRGLLCLPMKSGCALCWSSCFPMR